MNPSPQHAFRVHLIARDDGLKQVLPVIATSPAHAERQIRAIPRYADARILKIKRCRETADPAHPARIGA